MQYNSNNLKLAKNLRSNMTKEEYILWNILRAKKFYGYKFKRQVPIGNYIADFLCLEKFLIIEIDGGQHNVPQNVEKDTTRTIFFENRGYKILRFWNSDVRENLDGVCSCIKQTLESC